MTDLLRVTAPGYSWEEPTRAPTPPQERGTVDRWEARLDTGEQGEVGGGSRRMAQSRAESDGYGASKEDKMYGWDEGQSGAAVM